ncbi:uncharacterized protein A4U43_C05F23590 [Asparagus officinalis]|uniref:Uncharacterized protein n=1 Tax=Asparagus officinalis TaxID=4686 RepID=A0A5P1EZB6_ASPOF|nr:uncharacterized protein A4U43_C05F23590 [Asparagus officinalis]
MSDVDSVDSPISHSAYPSPQQGTLISAIAFTFSAIVLTVTLLYILLRENRRNSSIDNTSTAAAGGGNTASTSSSYHQNGKLKPERGRDGPGSPKVSP